jgi:hypothetical protein
MRRRQSQGRKDKAAGDIACAEGIKKTLDPFDDDRAI